MALEYLTVEHLNTKDLIRIFSKIEIHPDVSFNDTPCWISTCWLPPDGYRRISWGRRDHKELLHRIIFAWLIHPLPRGISTGVLDHLCRRPACCNPIHLEFVTQRVNALRGTSPNAFNARKTRCQNGHLLSGDNLYIQPSLPNNRSCKQCRTALRKQWRHDHKHTPEYIAYVKLERQRHKGNVERKRTLI